MKKQKSNLTFIKRKTLIVITMGTLLTLTTKIFAQDRWGVTLRGGADFATTKLGDANLNTGFGAEGVLSYRFLPHLHAYAGWSWNKFNSDQSFAGTDMDFEETGYLAGLQFIHPIKESRFSYLIGGGATYNHIEIENAEGDIISDSGHGFGYQAEAGVSIALSKHIKLVPSIRYRSLSREIKISEIPTAVDLNYLSAQLGLTYSF